MFVFVIEDIMEIAPTLIFGIGVGIGSTSVLMVVIYVLIIRRPNTAKRVTSLLVKLVSKWKCPLARRKDNNSGNALSSLEIRNHFYDNKTLSDLKRNVDKMRKEMKKIRKER